MNDVTSEAPAKRACPDCGGKNPACVSCAGKGVLPQVEITLERTVCPYHGESFRQKWPNGFAVFAMTAFEKVAAMETLADRCGGDIEKIMALLDTKPMCCQLPADQLLEVFRTVEQAHPDLWPALFCDVCRKVAPIASFNAINHWGRATGPERRCLNCLVSRTPRRYK